MVAAFPQLGRRYAPNPGNNKIVCTIPRNTLTQAATLTPYLGKVQIRRPKPISDSMRRPHSAHRKRCRAYWTARNAPPRPVKTIASSWIRVNSTASDVPASDNPGNNKGIQKGEDQLKKTAKAVKTAPIATKKLHASCLNCSSSSSAKRGTKTWVREPLITAKSNCGIAA